MKFPTYREFRQAWAKVKDSFPPEELAKLFQDRDGATDACRRACGVRGYDTVHPGDQVPWKPLVEQYNKWLQEGEPAKPGEKACACGCGLRMPYGAVGRKYLNNRHKQRAYRNPTTLDSSGLDRNAEAQDDPTYHLCGIGCLGGHIKAPY